MIICWFYVKNCTSVHMMDKIIPVTAACKDPAPFLPQMEALTAPIFCRILDNRMHDTAGPWHAVKRSFKSFRASKKSKYIACRAKKIEHKNAYYDGVKADSTTPTPTSSRGSSPARPTRLHPRKDVGVGVVECGLRNAVSQSPRRSRRWSTVERQVGRFGRLISPID